MGKILARILLNRLLLHLENDLLPKSHKLQEKCQEQNVNLYSTYVDLTKTFDTISKESLCRFMAKYRCPRKFISITRQFHDGMQARVKDCGESSTPLGVTDRVKQGCALAPTLFSLMFSSMLTEAFGDRDVGIWY